MILILILILDIWNFDTDTDTFQVENFDTYTIPIRYFELKVSYFRYRYDSIEDLWCSTYCYYLYEGAMWVQCGHLCGLLRSSASASGCLSATCATLSAIDPKASGQWGQASSFDLNQDFVSSGTTGSAKTAGMLWRWCFLTCLLLCSFEAATRLQKVWSLTQSFCLCLSGRSVSWKNLKIYMEENSL